MDLKELDGGFSVDDNVAHDNTEYGYQEDSDLEDEEETEDSASYTDDSGSSKGKVSRSPAGMSTTHV